MAATFGDHTNRNYSYFNPLSQYQKILETPTLGYRCILLSQLFANSPLKDLRSLFPRLVEDIFGFRNRADWGLNLNQNTLEFNDMRNFLSPEGPLFQLINRLLTDPHAEKFEFPISCLPASSRHYIENGEIPSVYTNKVLKIGDQISSNLQLNSFQFYFFHFTYFIIRPPAKQFCDFIDTCRCLYAYLLEDYLPAFLPKQGCLMPLTAEPQAPPSPPSPYRSTIWPEESKKDYTLQTILSSQTQVKPRRNLFKGNISAILNDSVNSSAVGHGNVPLKTEDWRSEEFLSILTEMYLNYVAQEFPHNRSLKEHHVPNPHHTWMVRIFVKHSHFFANSIVLSTHFYAPGSLGIDPMRNLKSSIFSRYIQKDMHSFLKVIFDTWPLDSSFHIPLELWLSYIQPWRYIHASLVNNGDKLLDRWQKYVSDNLHFYVPVFIKVLHRFSRMDLTCPRNALMLFRVCKVFSREHVADMIVSAEQCVQKNSYKPNLSWTFSPYSSSFVTSSPLPQMQRDTPDNENYISLHSKMAHSQVSQILKEILVAREREKGNNIQAANTQEANKGFFSQIFSFLLSEGSSIPEYGLDNKKVDCNLKMAEECLTSVFKVSLPILSQFAPSPASPASFINSTINGPENQSLQYSNIENLWTISKKKIKQHEHPCTGNPDLQPIRSYEIGFLVTILADISTYLNIKYQDKVQELYGRQTILGRMSKQLLEPPTTYRSIVKSKEMTRPHYETVQLPARICLRPLSDYRTVYFFFAYLLVMYFFNFHPFSAIVLLILINVIRLFFKALSDAWTSTAKRD